MKKKIRKPFPKSLENILLYKSARTCCVCRNPGAPVEIHHIDQDPSNNVEINLVVICRNCHDEAHTTHTMSKNLTKDRLLDFKKRWEQEVEKRSNQAMKIESGWGGMVWTFINHQIIPQFMKSMNLRFDERTLALLLQCGIVDKKGFPILGPKPKNKKHVTIYDQIEWDHSHRLHHMYIDVLEKLIESQSPIEIGAIWSKSEILDIVKPGDICFCIRGFRFKRSEVIDQVEDRYVYARASGIEIRMFANTRHMFGVSSLYVNFAGHKFTAVLMLVKNIARENGVLVINATPIAMGTGFRSYSNETPYSLKYGWAKNA